LCDVVSPKFYESVRASKDIAAGAVLFAVIAAAMLGVLPLGPYLPSYSAA